MNKKISILLMMMCLSFGVSVVAKPTHSMGTKVSTELNTVELIDVYAWHNFMPKTSFENKISKFNENDGGPLLLKATFEISSSSKKDTDISWSAYVVNSGKKYPVKLIKFNRTWSSDLNGGLSDKITLHMINGPLLRQNAEMILVVDFLINGQEVQITSKPTVIDATY